MIADWSGERGLGMKRGSGMDKATGAGCIEEAGVTGTGAAFVRVKTRASTISPTATIIAA